MEQKGGKPRTEPKEIDKVRALTARTVSGNYRGESLQFYSFIYNGVDEKWHEGTVVPTHDENFHELKGSCTSFWTVDVKKGNEVKRMASPLFQLSHHAFMQPLFCVHNTQISKFVMACSPGTGDFKKWISKQVVIPSDGYIPIQGKNMIRSIVSFGETVWKEGFVCDGLEDPKNYRMLDSKVKVIPFTVRPRLPNDDPMIHRYSFASLLEKEIFPKWKDPDLTEFIKLLRNPVASIQDLIHHPLLLEPEKRLALYQTLYPSVLSLHQIALLRSLPSLGKWKSRIGPQDELHGVLTYKSTGSGNCMVYAETQDEAFRFGCNASSHYMRYWKSNTHHQLRQIASDQADKSLKKLLPGLLAQVYGLIFHGDWRL